MKPTQEELATKLYDSLLNYEDAFNVMDVKVRDVFNRQSGTIAGLEKRIERLRETLKQIADMERDGKYKDHTHMLYDAQMIARLALKEGE